MTRMRTEVFEIPVTVNYEGIVCEWDIQDHPKVWVGHRGALSKRFYEIRESPKKHPRYDARELRHEFLTLQTEREFLEFLNRVGRFAPLFNPQVVEMGHWEADELEPLTGQWDVESFRRWQQMFNQFLKQSPDTWDSIVERIWSDARPNGNLLPLVRDVLRVCSRFSIQFVWKRDTQFEWKGARHASVINTRDVVSAILATIYVDRLGGKEFGFCARSDCRRAYEITSQHKRKYCGQPCAHLESLRRLRKRRSRKNRKVDRKRHANQD